MALDTWSLEETGFDGEHIAQGESLFSIGNGYIGFRGFPCEREPAQHPGCFINGFYELSPIHYGEDAYGFARFNQTMLDIPDCRYLRIRIEGIFVSLSDERVKFYRRHLDFRTGILEQHMQWLTDEDNLVHITWETLFSMQRYHIGAVRVRIHSNATVQVQLQSTIGMPIHRASTERDPRVGTLLSDSSLFCDDCGYYADGPEARPGFQASFKTRESALRLSCGAVHESSEFLHAERDEIEEGTLPVLHFSWSGSDLSFTKYFYYHTSGRPGETLPLELAQQYRTEIVQIDWESLVEMQRIWYETFWAHTDIEITGDEKLQQALRFNFFQLQQSTGRDGMSALAAKGLTGSGYEGHYFWDTEIYAMSLFNHTLSDTARALISYRISTLDSARARAREMHQKGALYPWRTINGLEASAYFPAGTAQYHINADIAYAILQYLEVTGDDSILDEGAAEVLIETARLFLDLGFFNPEKGGRFCINEVTGPDEYSALIDNNCYTNVMVQHHFEGVVQLASRLKKNDSSLWNRLAQRLAITDEELGLFAKAAEHMYVPYDRQRGINMQDDSFLSKEPWDIQKRGELRHPMLLHYHPLVIYRHRVIKQADTVLAMLLQHHRFPWYQRKRNFEFYEPLTTGDSSLSACIQGIVAYDCGSVDLGSAYIRQTALMDIEDLHHNTKDGLHTAAMAGTWMAMVYGLGGFRMREGLPSFRPQLPQQLQRLRFHLTFKGVVLTVTIEPMITTYEACGGTITLLHRSDTITVGKEAVQCPTQAKCKAVIFDLDGVITSTDEYHYRAWKRLADANGWEFTEELNQHLRGISRKQSLQVILDYNRVKVSEQRMLELTEQKNTWYRESLEDLSPDEILPGILVLLEHLKQHRIRTAIASASRNAPFILEQLGLSDVFDAIVPAEEVVLGKPDPEVFARAADLLGVYPEECTGVEDAPAGITAITEASMRPVGVGSAVDPSTCSAHVLSTANLTVDMLLW
ncbi:MAG: beta-phosphoglucomutase [Sphaerochaetaceae bacterium]